MSKRLTDQERLWRTVPESDVLKGVMDHFRMRGGFCWRANTGSFVGEYNGKTRYVQFGEKGQADVIGVLNGRIYCFETKRELGKVSEEQHAWRQLIEAAGGIWRVCRPSDFTEVIDRAVGVLGEEGGNHD